MNKIKQFPVVKTYPKYCCGTCDGELFELAESNGKLIAVCAACDSPTIQLECGCLVYREKIDE